MKLTPTIRASKETTQALRRIALKLGYVLKSGTLAGEGDVPAMLEAVAQSKLEIRKIELDVAQSIAPADMAGASEEGILD